MTAEPHLVVLCHKQTVKLTAIPRSLKVPASQATTLGLNSITWTAGDWVRVEAPKGRIRHVQLMSLAVDATVTGVEATHIDAVIAPPTQRRVRTDMLHLSCNSNGQPAVQIW
jgi:hypothetical protein